MNNIYGFDDDTPLGLAVLLRSLERETVEFERRAANAPFLPLEVESTKRSFLEHCKCIDALSFRECAPKDVRHVCYMAVCQQNKVEWTAIQYRRLGKDSEHASRKITWNSSALDLIVTPCAETGFIPDIQGDPVANATPQRVTGEVVLLITYLVGGMNEPYLQEHLRAGRLTDDPNHVSPLICDATLIPWKNKSSRLAAIKGLKELHGIVNPLFESFHLCWVPPMNTQQNFGDRESLRALSMQFQREWANRDEQLLHREGLLLSLAHEFKGAITAVDWRSLLKKVSDSDGSDWPELKKELQWRLSCLSWPDGLAIALRAFANTIRGSGKLSGEFLEDQLAESVMKNPETFYANSVGQYEQSISYLLDFISGSINEVSKYQPSVKKMEGSEFHDLLEMDPLSVTPTWFDVSKLTFAPLRMTEAAQILAASFVAEPIRNALNYIVQNEIKDGEIQWGTAATKSGVRVRIRNSLASVNASAPRISSIDLLKEIGKTIGIATIVGPTVWKNDNRAYLQIDIEFHPHLIVERL